MAQIATQPKSSLARSVSVHNGSELAQRLFVVRTLIEQDKLKTLVLEVRKHHLTVEAMNEAVTRLGAGRVQLALLTHLPAPMNTTILHEIFRTGQICIMEWIGAKMPTLLAAREQDSMSTPAHIIAQRAASELGNFINDFFTQTDELYLGGRDFNSYVPMHYLGLFGHQQAYTVMERRFPRMCHTVATDHKSPASLNVARLKHDFADVSHHNKRLLLNEEGVKGAELMFDRMRVAVKQREKVVKEQEARIKALTAEQATLNEKQARQAAQVNLQAQELAKAHALCTKAQTEATEARAALRQASTDLDAAQKENDALRAQRSALKTQLATNLASTQQSTDAQTRLQTEIERLRDERNTAATHIDTAENASEAAVARNKELLSSIGQLESQIDELNRQHAAKESEHARMLIDKERILEERAAIEARLERQQRERDALESEAIEQEERTEALEALLQDQQKQYCALQAELEEQRQQASRLRSQQSLLETEHKQRLAELARESEALRAQLVDARTAQRQAETKARSEIDDARRAMNEVSVAAAAAQRRASNLQAELALERNQAAEEIRQLRATAQRRLDQHADPAPANATPPPPPGVVMSSLAEVEAELNARLQAQVDAVAVSQTQCAELQARLVESQQRIDALEQSSAANYAAASQWETFMRDVQSRHDTSMRELEARLQQSQEVLLRTRKDLEQQRALTLAATAASLPPPPLPADAKPTPTPRGLLRSSSKMRTLRAPSVETEQVSTPRRVGEREEDLKTQIMRRNEECNVKYFANIFLFIRNGNFTALADAFQHGLNPNTRYNGADDRCRGQTMLEVLVRHAQNARSSKLISDTNAMDMAEKLTKTLVLILEAGGDWEELDDFVSSNSGTLPDKFLAVLKKRDDAAPFCRALLKNNGAEAEMHLATVENFNRVPSKYEAEKYSYVHVVVLNENARLLQAIIQTGRADVRVRDARNRTPLHLVLQMCADRETRLEIVKYLLAAGARVNEACTDAQIIATTRGSNAGRKGLFAKFRNKDKEGATINEIVSNSQHYGTPMAMARAIGDDELVRAMASRRYRLPTTEGDDDEDHDDSTPMLQEYIINCVNMHNIAEDLVATGQLSENDQLYHLYQRYRDVFQCFNPNYGGALGYEGVRDSINRAAGINKLITAPDEADALLHKLVADDEKLLSTMATSGSSNSKPMPVLEFATAKTFDSNDDDEDVAVVVAEAGRIAAEKKLAAVTANTSPFWTLCQKLLQATKAVSERWFDVTNMIEAPAHEMYPRAVLLALRHFVKNNNVAALDYMINRQDRLFGDIDINTIVDEKLQFSCIELAAHVGVADTFEWLMDRQRARIDQVGATGRSLVSVASAAGQPIICVLFDHFKFQNKISTERHPNAQHYGILTSVVGNTVLHQCALQQRADLLAFCIDSVAYQVNKNNRAGHTPLKAAQHTYAGVRNFRSANHERAARDCIRILEERIASEGGVYVSPRARSVAQPPPGLTLPPLVFPASALRMPPPATPAPERPLPAAVPTPVVTPTPTKPSTTPRSHSGRTAVASTTSSDETRHRHRRSHKTDESSSTETKRHRHKHRDEKE